EVMSISVMQEINRIPMAKIILRDGNAAERNFRSSNDDHFIPGRKIRIKIGMDGDDTQVFKGIILKHAIKVLENGNAQLHIECRDETLIKPFDPRSWSFAIVKDSAVFEELAAQYDIRTEYDDTPVTNKDLVQHHTSDWDFVLPRA